MYRLGALLLLVWSFAAQAQPATLMLACKGTAIFVIKPEGCCRPEVWRKPAD
jgi:hypothetical protein